MRTETVTTHLRIRVPDGHRPALFNGAGRSRPLSQDTIHLSHGAATLGHQSIHGGFFRRCAESIGRNPGTVSLPLTAASTIACIEDPLWLLAGSPFVDASRFGSGRTTAHEYTIAIVHPADRELAVFSGTLAAHAAASFRKTDVAAAAPPVIELKHGATIGLRRPNASVPMRVGEATMRNWGLVPLGAGLATAGASWELIRIHGKRQAAQRAAAEAATASAPAA